MQVLYTKTNEELAVATSLFQRHMEPLLRRLEDAARDGHPIACRRLSQDYRDVCRWPFRQLEYSFAMAAIMDHGPVGTDVLDAGSGITPFGHALARMGFDVCACDYDRPLMEDLAAARMEDIYGSVVRYEWQDLTALRFADDSFDVITCISVLEHIQAPSDQMALRELTRVLKPGGQLIVTVDYEPSPAAPRQGGRYRRRVAELVHNGDFGGLIRAAKRKLKGRLDVAGGLARNIRTANQCFTLAHLQQDLLPLLKNWAQDLDVPYAAEPHLVHAEDVPGFWNLESDLFDRQGRRVVLPAAIQAVKH